MMNRTVAWVAALSATAIIVLGGCSDDSSSSAESSSAAASSSAVVSMKDQIPSPFTDDPQMPNTFVGSVDGTDAYIAVVTSGSAAMAFVCDGEKMWAWMDGTVDNGKLDMTGADGAKLEATVDGDAGIKGSLTMTGASGKAFTAVAAAPGEGVYRTVMTKDGQEMTLGWIIRTEGARGLLRTSGGTNTNGVNTNRDDDDRARDRRERRQEEDRCNKLARDLADAQATLAFIESQPRIGGNIQMVALNQQRVQRLIAAQCN